VQKNRKRSEGSDIRPPRRSSALPLPEVVTIDDLGIMVDDDLVARLRVLEEDKNRAYESHIDTRPWEEEIAYIRREQQVRRVRRDNHVEYTRKEADEFARAEFNLPAGDFDNSSFVYAATGGRPRWN